MELQRKELSIFRMEPGPAKIPKSQMAVPEGAYTVHTYLGDKVFADEFKWISGHGSTLTVPGKFTSQIENMELLPQFGVSFEILVSEDKQPYRVRYVMQFSPDLSQATGTLVNLTTGQTMGSFVAIRR